MGRGWGRVGRGGGAFLISPALCSGVHNVGGPPRGQAIPVPHGPALEKSPGTGTALRQPGRHRSTHRAILPFSFLFLGRGFGDALISEDSASRRRAGFEPMDLSNILGAPRGRTGKKGERGQRVLLDVHPGHAETSRSRLYDLIRNFPSVPQRPFWPAQSFVARAKEGAAALGRGVDSPRRRSCPRNKLSGVPRPRPLCTVLDVRSGDPGRARLRCSDCGPDPMTQGCCQGDSGLFRLGRTGRERGERREGIAAPPPPLGEPGALRGPPPDASAVPGTPPPSPGVLTAQVRSSHAEGTFWRNPVFVRLFSP